MKYYKNQTYYLELALLNKSGNFVTGRTITYKVYKSLDETLYTSGVLTEIGTSGVYKDSIIFTDLGQYRVEYTTPTKFDNVIETFMVEDTLQRILGLSQENYRIFNPTYVTKNNQACMTSATIKIYPTSADVDADTNAIAEYTVTATFDNSARMINYKVKKV